MRQADSPMSLQMFQTSNDPKPLAIILSLSAIPPNQGERKKKPFKFEIQMREKALVEEKKKVGHNMGHSWR